MMNDPLILLATGTAFLFLLILLHVPVGAAMAISGVVSFGLIVGFGPAFSTIAVETATALTSADLATIPLFLLMGTLAARAGLAVSIYDIAGSFMGHWRGGLAMSTIAGCAGFGALCGSSLATTATMAKVALPEMRQRGYSPELSAGAIAGGGSLGILIPPSIVMIIYAVLTEQFVLDLFVAGILPGILAACLYCLAIGIYVRFYPGTGPASQKANWRQRIKTVMGAWRVVVIILAVTGGIYSGIFTVLEAAAVGVVLTFIFFMLAPIENRKTALLEILAQTARTTGMIFLMVIGAHLFNYFLTISGAAEVLVNSIAGSGLPPWLILLVIIIMYLILGAIFDTIAAMVLTLPFIFPLIVSLGYDPIWWGIINVMVIEIGLITPPIGMNVFIMHNIAQDLSLRQIYRGIIPFLAADIIRLAILLIFPMIALFLVQLLK